MSDTDDADDVVVERLPPDEAFELLAHETRVQILQALNDAEESLAFSELRRRVGVRDAGQFNYHLGKLVGRFVDDGDEGYRLTRAGAAVVGAVLSGGVTKALESDPVPIDADCERCGEPMEIGFRDDNVQVACSACDWRFSDIDVPPGVLEGCAREDVPDVVDRWLKQLLNALTQGFCHNCDGQFDRTVHLDPADSGVDWGDTTDSAVVVDHECRRCGALLGTTGAELLLTDPAVACFRHDHGVDFRNAPVWDLDVPWEDAGRVASEDPLHVDLCLTLDDETLVLTVDEDLNVVGERREERA